MHPVKLVFIATALAALYFYLPPLLASSGLAPTAICLLAAFYLGFSAGKAVEFCIDRYKVAKRL